MCYIHPRGLFKDVVSLVNTSREQNYGGAAMRVLPRYLVFLAGETTMGFCSSSLSALQKTNRESRYMHGISQMKQLNVIQTSIFHRSNNIISISGIKRKGTQ